MRVLVGVCICSLPCTYVYMRFSAPSAFSHPREEKTHMYTMDYANVLKYDAENLENVSMAIYIGPPVTEIEIF
jgi:hypothetical protein